MSPVILFFGCLLLCATVVQGLRVMAPSIGLMDIPGGRKDHAENTPLVGGLAIASTISVVLVGMGLSSWHAGLLISLLIIVACGACDDRIEIGSGLRLVFQMLAGLVMIFFSGVKLTTVGDLVGNGPIGMWIFVVPMSIFAACGVINAFNMVDGTDGACGLLGLVASAFFYLVALESGLSIQADFLLALCGAIAGFLLFNLRHPWQKRARVFLGDAGSTLIGFLLAWFAIDLTQGPGRSLPPISALWIVVIPLCDTVSLMARRIAARRSPFSADRQHLHHLLLNLGLSPAQVAMALGAIGLTSGLIGVLGWKFEVPEPVLFAMFVLLFISYHLAMRSYWARHQSPVDAKTNQNPDFQTPAKQSKSNP